MSDSDSESSAMDWSDEYVTYFEQLCDGLSDQCRQHDEQARMWHNWNDYYTYVFALISAVLVLNGPFNSSFPTLMPWIITLAGAANAGLLYLYGKQDPLGKKAAHLKAEAAKGAIVDRIKQEMLQKPEDREDPDEFMTWVLKDIGTVSDASPNLWLPDEPESPSIERKQRKDKGKERDDSDVSDDSETSETPLLKPHED